MKICVIDSSRSHLFCYNYKHLSSQQVYFWIYDPVHFKTFAMGLILGRFSSSTVSVVSLTPVQIQSVVCVCSHCRHRSHSVPPVACRDESRRVLPERGSRMLRRQHITSGCWYEFKTLLSSHNLIWSTTFK